MVRGEKYKKIVIVLTIIVLTLFISTSYERINLEESKQEILKEEKEEIITSEEPYVIDEQSKIIEEPIIEEKNESKKNNEKTGMYWYYTNIKLINVDIKELKKKNNDTVGWIQVAGTNINYPFVKTNNNTYYLNHSFNKSKNNAGWIFLDYRNDINNFKKNTIIYGHSRLNKTMFGTLNKVTKSNWLNNKENHIIRITSENENSLWQVFSVYRIKTTSDYLRTSFAGNKDFENFIKLITNRSMYNFKVDVDKDDHILTLSTCADNDKKTVVHAKLIKKN